MTIWFDERPVATDCSMRTLDARGFVDADLQGVTLEGLADKISGMHVVAVIGATGFWSQVRPLWAKSPSRRRGVALPETDPRGK